MNILVKKCRDAVKTNLVPGLILQFMGLMLVLGYYYVPAITNWCQVITDLKAEYGILFSCISTSVAGGLIPALFLLYTGKVESGQAVKVILFYVIFWFYKGGEASLFIDYQAQWFGEDASFSIIARKVFVDQFIYNPFYSVPSIAIIYFWKDSAFSYTLLKQGLNREMFFVIIPSVLVSVWVVWIPMCSIIYTLPTPLQVPLNNIVLCFFVLIISILCDNNPDQQPIETELAVQEC